MLSNSSLPNIPIFYPAFTKYIKKDFQKMTKLYMQFFFQIQANHLKSYYKRQLKARFLNLYYKKFYI